MLNAKEIELMGLAEAATFGDIWYTEKSKLLYEGATGDVHPLLPNDKALIVAANPAAILALLAELDGARFAAAQHLQTVECQAKCLAGHQCAAPAPIQSAESVDLEEVFQSWDGCLYDSVGETIDIGAWLRINLAALAAPAATPAQPIAPAADVSAPTDERPELTVWYGDMPESNGKSNFTAILMRKDGDKWDNMTDGITIDRSEYPDRVRYEADRVRYLIGEITERPFILDYDDKKHSGYVERAARAAAPVSGPTFVQHIPGNFTTHRSAWRDAITECNNHSVNARESDRAAYWKHELAAYDRAFTRLLDKPERAISAAPVSGQGASIAETKPWEHGESISPRQPYYEDEPDGYLESDSEFMERNRFAAVWLLENAERLCIDSRPRSEDSAAPAPIQSAEFADKSSLRDAVAESLRGNYYCGRVWSAWGIGTMGEDDFTPSEEVDECIDQVMDAIRPFLAAPTAQQEQASSIKGRTPHRYSLEQLGALLPLETMWGDELYPDLLEYILDSYDEFKAKPEQAKPTDLQAVPQWECSVPLYPFDAEIIEAMSAEIAAHRAAQEAKPEARELTDAARTLRELAKHNSGNVGSLYVSAPRDVLASIAYSIERHITPPKA